jgi:ABC-2 type transport system permease protein
VSAIFRLILRTQVTRGRAAALATVGLIGILLGFAIGRSDRVDNFDAAHGFVGGYGLGLLVPLTALVFAAAALGDPAEDGTLVYLWQRPIGRWRIVAAAAAAALCVAVPFAVVPTMLAAAATGQRASLVVGAGVASLLAAAAYSGIFLCLGLLVRRALAWGLAYVLIWEGFVARSGTGAARLSILVYARSLLAALADHAPPRLAASVGVSIAVPLVIAAAGIAATTWALRRIDVR